MAGSAPSPHQWGPRFWAFNTCRIKFVSVQSVLGKGPWNPRGKFLPAGRRSSPVSSLAAAPGHAMGSCSRGCVHATAGLGGSRVLSWGCAGAGMGQETARTHPQGQLSLRPRSEPGNFHTVQPQQAQALPGGRALHRSCLQGDLEAGEDDENGTRGMEALDARVLPLRPARSVPALQGRGWS